MNAAVIMEGVTRSFGKKQVLRGVTGTVAEGRVVGLLGKNGEGKTTLFRILLDILRADSGEVRVLDMVPNGSARIRLKVGYVPEQPVFHEFWNVQQSLDFRSRLFPSWDREKATKLAHQLDLDLRAQIRGASKGTLAKAAWICAVAHDPKLLLLDEPTSGLDALVRDSVITNLVGELVKEGKTVFVGNHHMEELSTLLDEVWLLSEGLIRKKYFMDQIRANACRITGRLRSVHATIGNLPVIEECRTGNLVHWVTLDPKAVEHIRDEAILESMETEPLSTEKLFRLLMKAV